MKTKLFLLLLALSVLRTQAQSLSIKGRVTDTSQEAIIAANVSLWTIDSTLVTGVTSDAQGKFTLHKIKAGDYRLSISFIGLQSENILLKLNERISKVAPFRSETFVRETGQMVVLRVGYTFEFGRKHKAGNKGLNNSDTDSGIINMQR